MSVQPKELLQYAESVGEDCDEATARSALSRAYYAAYHSLLPYVEKLPAVKGNEYDDHICHREVERRLEIWAVRGDLACLAAYERAAQRVALTFRSARTMRALADYRLSDSLGKDAVKIQCGRVKQILTFCSQLELHLQRLAS